VTALGWLGVALLVGGVVATLIEGVIAAVWMRRVSAKGRLLSEGLEGERTLINADLERLRQALDETRALWQPYHKALRLVRHPLVVAVTRSMLGRGRAGI
jgi:hypothetical protein